MFYCYEKRAGPLCTFLTLECIIACIVLLAGGVRLAFLPGTTYGLENPVLVVSIAAMGIIWCDTILAILVLHGKYLMSMAVACMMHGMVLAGIIGI